jgi:hypothetical protein
MPSDQTWVVEVNEGTVEASRQGLDWWMHFRTRHNAIGRLRETRPALIVGGLVEVACEDEGHAGWLAGFMVEHGGLPRTAVRVKRPPVADQAVPLVDALAAAREWAHEHGHAQPDDRMLAIIWRAGVAAGRALYATDGDQECATPHPLGGNGCQRPIGHDTHLRRVSGGSEGWARANDAEESR